MNLEEAREWLLGNRSSWNTHCQAAPNISEANANCAVDDAAKTQQAYWIVRAADEGLVDHCVRGK